MYWRSLQLSIVTGKRRASLQYLSPLKIHVQSLPILLSIDTALLATPTIMADVTCTQSALLATPIIMADNNETDYTPQLLDTALLDTALFLN